MMGELERIETRIHRADETRKALVSLIQSYSKDDYTFSCNKTEDLSVFEICGNWDATGKLTRASVLFSEILHHLSTSLDNLVFHICKKGGNLQANEARNLYFPICDTLDLWEKDKSVKIFRKHASEKEFHTLKWFQPFKNGPTWDDSDLVPLKVLRDLINIDKHRNLHLASTGIENIKVNLTGEIETDTDLDQPVKFTFFSDGLFNSGKFCEISFATTPRQFHYDIIMDGKIRIAEYNLVIDKLAIDLTLAAKSIFWSFQNIQNPNIKQFGDGFFDRG